MNTTSTSSGGYIAAISAYFIWGIFPLYWRLLQQVPALEIMLHRVAWCFVFVCLVLFALRGRSWLSPFLQNPRLLKPLALSSLFISGNWYMYIWAINNGHIVETSLGYYINPLVNVALGTLLLKERLNRTQKFAVGIAAVGVVYLTLSFGRPPWIAFFLALSFASYGFIRKKTQVDSMPALAIEGALVMPIVIAALAFLHWQGQAVFTSGALSTQTLLVLGGPVTAIPLILFGLSARRIPYSAIGMLQYIAPTLQLILGVLVFEESFDRHRLFGFSCIWLALAIYTSDGIRRYSRSSG